MKRHLCASTSTLHMHPLLAQVDFVCACLSTAHMSGSCVHMHLPACAAQFETDRSKLGRVNDGQACMHAKLYLRERWTTAWGFGTPGLRHSTNISICAWHVTYSIPFPCSFLVCKFVLCLCNYLFNIYIPHFILYTSRSSKDTA